MLATALQEVYGISPTRAVKALPGRATNSRHKPGGRHGSAASAGAANTTSSGVGHAVDQGLTSATLAEPLPPESPERNFVMGPDPLSDALLLVPISEARADALFNRTLYGQTTMGQVREIPAILDIIEEWLDGVDWGGDPWVECFGASRDDLPDDFAFKPSEHFLDHDEYRHLILGPSRTEELAPEEILDEFGRDDDLPGRPSTRTRCSGCTPTTPWRSRRGWANWAMSSAKTRACSAAT